MDELAALDSNSPEFGKKVDQLTAMGRKEIAEAAGASNRFLDRPVKAIDKRHRYRRRPDRASPHGRSARPQGCRARPRKLLGIIPFGNRIDRYFDKYRSSQTHIQKILGSLANGKDELLMDNAAIDTERANLWKTMHKLEQMVHISKTLDQRLEDKANELDATDPAKAKAIRETALFYTRQRTTDLLTQMAVTVQGYLALDLVKKNNVELVKGVDRASTTTVSALRTAVTVAQAMSNQKLVLEQIGALNTTTAGMIDSTGEMLRTQSSAIHEQAASSTIPMETLQRAFQNIYDTMDQIDAFKLQALGNMKQTVETLGKEVEKSKGYIARAEGVNQAKLAGPVTSPLDANRGQVTDVTDKVERAIARFDRVTQQLDQRGGPAQAAARRERQRLNAGLGRTVLTVAVAVALIWVGGNRHRVRQADRGRRLLRRAARERGRGRNVASPAAGAGRSPRPPPRPTFPMGRWSSGSTPISTRFAAPFPLRPRRSSTRISVDAAFAQAGVGARRYARSRARRTRGA